MSPSTACGVGTVFDAGQVVDERRRENGSVVYSFIFFV